jgi:serine/threonine protein phosphatase PrpC
MGRQQNFKLSAASQAAVRAFTHKYPHVAIRAVSRRGQREYMEDQMNVRRVGATGLLLTVCDGHGGAGCAKYVIEHFPARAARALTDPDLHQTRVGTRLRNAAVAVAREWDVRFFGTQKLPRDAKARAAWFRAHASTAKNWDTSGTTLIAAYLDMSRDKCFLLNLGDSRAHWRVGAQLAACGTADHKPSARYAATVKNFKCWVTPHGRDGDVWRVNGELAVSHAIGDNTRTLFGCISRKPDVYPQISFAGQSFQMTVASDGLWDEVQAQELMPSATESDFSFVKKLNPKDNMTLIHVMVQKTKKKSD